MSCEEPPPPELLEGIAQFNRGEYFEQHETLELLWRAERRDVRYLYQGILQIGVAFHHLRRLNHHGTVYMLTRGPRYLAPFAPALPARRRRRAPARRRRGAARGRAPGTVPPRRIRLGPGGESPTEVGTARCSIALVSGLARTLWPGPDRRQL